MKPKYEETIEIIPKIDGDLLCTLTWRDQTWQEKLPRGCDRWPPKQFQVHLKTVVIPKLRLQLLKAQREALEAETVPIEACLAIAEFTPTDVELMRKAEEKRERKAKKLAN